MGTTDRIRSRTATIAFSIIGGIMALVGASGLTILISIAIGLVWAGGLAARAGITTSLGTGIVVGLLWALMWLFLMGRFDTRLWLSEALPAITWRHVLAWASAPAFSTFGGFLRLRVRWFRGLALNAVGPVVVLLVMSGNQIKVQSPGDDEKYQVFGGAQVLLSSAKRTERAQSNTSLPKANTANALPRYFWRYSMMFHAATDATEGTLEDDAVAIIIGLNA